MENFQKVRIGEAGNIGAAVRNTIPGIGTGNPGHISERLCRKRSLDDFAVRDILFEHRDGSWNANVRFYDERGIAEGGA